MVGLCWNYITTLPAHFLRAFTVGADGFTLQLMKRPVCFIPVLKGPVCGGTEHRQPTAVTKPRYLTPWEWERAAASTSWIDSKFSTDIRGSQMMHPNDFGDPLTFELREMSQQSWMDSHEI